MPLVPRLLNTLIAPCCCSGNNIICFNDDNGLRRFSLSVWTLKSLNFPPGRLFQVSVFLSSLCGAEGRHVPSVSVVYCFFNFFFGVFFLCLPSDYMCSSADLLRPITAPVPLLSCLWLLACSPRPLWQHHWQLHLRRGKHTGRTATWTHTHTHTYKQTVTSGLTDGSSNCISRTDR